MANMNCGGDALLQYDRCPDCHRPVVWSHDATTRERIPLEPSLAIYVIKRVVDTKHGDRQVYVRPSQFFDGRRLAQYAALADHRATCSARGAAPAFDADYNQGRDCQLSASKCKLCQGPIIWAANYLNPQQSLPMSVVPVLIVKRVYDDAALPNIAHIVEHVHETPRQFLTGRELHDYAMVIGHHADCPVYLEQQRTRAAQARAAKGAK